jgi:hypothetical protein
MHKSPIARLDENATHWSSLGAVLAGVALLLGLADYAYCGAATGPHTAEKPLMLEAEGGAKPVAAPNRNKTAQRVSPPESSGPKWSELTPAQQLALKPLLANWDSLSEARKRKWLAMSNNYAQMSNAEQSKLQSRMTEWVTLSAQQRNQARLNYVQARTISPTEKQAKWEAYQALSPEEKRVLATKAPAVTKGAAPAVKPVAPQQLTVVPTSRQSVKPGQKIATATNKIDQKTLLPRPEKSTALAATVPAPAAPVRLAPPQ